MGKKSVLMMLSILVFTGCASTAKWQKDYPDNYLEELFEKMIEEKTGKNIDLTPITGDEFQSFEDFLNEKE